MSIVVVDYGSGNVHSAAKAFERAAASVGGGQTVTVSGQAEALADASHVVLTGVGAFSDCRRMLEARGLWVPLKRFAASGKPFLGICVGMQLMASRGHEHGEHQGFDWVEGDVVALAANGRKVPHMGWNELRLAEPAHPLMAGIVDGEHMYFVHGYQMRCADPRDIVATTDYGESITAVLAKNNRAGVQFHPEKSQAAGLHFIGNFLRWQP